VAAMHAPTASVGGLLTTSTRPTSNLHLFLRVVICMRVHPGCKLFSDLDRAIVDNQLSTHVQSPISSSGRLYERSS
jgi:hypothetical protein